MQGKAIGRALKDQAISTGTNLLADIVAGNNLNEGINREVGNIRQNAALGIQQLTNNKPYESDDECEIETSKKIQLKRKNQTKNKKQTKKKNQPPKKGGKKFKFLNNE